MENIMAPLINAPFPTILVAGGLLFFFLFFGGRLGKNIAIDREKQKYAGGLGAVLLIAGVVLFWVFSPPSPSKPNVTEASSNAPQVRAQADPDEKDDSGGVIQQPRTDRESVTRHRVPIRSTHPTAKSPRVPQPDNNKTTYGNQTAIDSEGTVQIEGNNNRVSK